MEETLERVGRIDSSYQWIGEVDADTGTFDVDFDLVQLAVKSLIEKTTGIILNSEDQNIEFNNKPKIKI